MDIGCWGERVGEGLKNNYSLVYQILDMVLKLITSFSNMTSSLMVSKVLIWIICFLGEGLIEGMKGVFEDIRA